MDKMKNVYMEQINTRGFFSTCQTQKAMWAFDLGAQQ